MVSQAENWKLVQTIGAKPLGSLVDGDVVSAVEFDGEKSFHLHTILHYSGVYTGPFSRITVLRHPTTPQLIPAPNAEGLMHK